MSASEMVLLLIMSLVSRREAAGDPTSSLIRFGFERAIKAD